MEGERQECTEAPMRSRISSWKSTVRRNLACGTSQSTSKPFFPVEWAKEKGKKKSPVVAQEIDRAERPADRAHQDVLETLQKMALTTTTSYSLSGQDYTQHVPLQRAPTAITSSPGSSISAAADSTPPVPQEQEPRSSPRSSEPDTKVQQQPQRRRRQQRTREPPSTPSTPPPAPHTPSLPLEALLYFAVEQPNHGGFIRHYNHPLRLNLSTLHARASAARTLRGYLTDQPGRFLSHFGLTQHQHHHRDPGGGGGLAASVSGLSSVSRVIEGTWGRGATWADARDEAFAPALVGVLGHLAAGQAARRGAATVDVCVIVRQICCHRGRGECDGMSWCMDARRVVRRPAGPVDVRVKKEVGDAAARRAAHHGTVEPPQ